MLFSTFLRLRNEKLGRLEQRILYDGMVAEFKDSFGVACNTSDLSSRLYGGRVGKHPLVGLVERFQT